MTPMSRACGPKIERSFLSTSDDAILEAVFCLIAGAAASNLEVTQPQDFFPDHVDVRPSVEMLNPSVLPVSLGSPARPRCSLAKHSSKSTRRLVNWQWQRSRLRLSA